MLTFDEIISSCTGKEVPAFWGQQLFFSGGTNKSVVDLGLEFRGQSDFIQRIYSSDNFLWQERPSPACHCCPVTLPAPWCPGGHCSAPGCAAGGVCLRLQDCFLLMQYRSKQFPVKCCPLLCSLQLGAGLSQRSDQLE